MKKTYILNGNSKVGSAEVFNTSKEMELYEENKKLRKIIENMKELPIALEAMKLEAQKKKLIEALKYVAKEKDCFGNCTCDRDVALSTLKEVENETK